jgi:uncharacterized protein YjgD (DUF1641 family)
MPEKSLEEKLRQLDRYLDKEKYLLLTMAQLKKDFILSGLDFDYRDIPENLYSFLQEKVTHLLNNNMEGLRNLLYRIDVNVENIFKNPSSNIAEKITQEIIKRSLQKVIIREHYKAD